MYDVEVRIGKRREAQLLRNAHNEKECLFSSVCHSKVLRRDPNNNMTDQ